MSQRDTDPSTKSTSTSSSTKISTRPSAISSLSTSSARRDTIVDASQVTATNTEVLSTDAPIRSSEMNQIMALMQTMSQNMSDNFRSMVNEIASVKSELSGEILSVKSQLNADISSVKSGLSFVMNDLSTLKLEVQPEKSETNIRSSINENNTQSIVQFTDSSSSSGSKHEESISSTTATNSRPRSIYADPSISPLPPTANSSIQNRSKPNASNNVRSQMKDDLRINEDVIREEPDDDRNEYASFVAFLKKREETYPYVNDRYKRLYFNRCSLLSHNGRVNEYYRFGVVVNFTRDLYPSSYSRWFKRYMDLDSNGTSNIRDVDIGSLTIPNMYYDSRDQRLMTRSNEDNDLPPYCVTYEELPRELQLSPATVSAFHITPPSLEETAYRYLHQLKVRKSKPSIPAPIRSSQDVRVSSPSSTPMIRELSIEDEGRYFGVPYPRTKEQTESSTSVYSQPEAHIVKVKREHDERIDREKDSHYHQQMRQHHILRDVIDSFDEGTRMMCRLTQSDRIIEDKDVPKYITSTIAALERFSGDPDKAPQWFQSLILSLVKINFTQADVISIVDARMTGGAKQWLTAAMLKVAPLANTDAAIPTLFGLFREQYMNKTHVVNYRKRLSEMTITDIFITQSDLRLHYTKFTQIANNLKICDRFTSDDTIIQMFVDSLPRSIRNYLGTSYKACNSVDAVFQLAEEACKSNEKKKKVDLDGEAVKINSIHDYESDELHEVNDCDDYIDDEVDFLPERDIQHLWVMAHNIRNKRTPLVKEDVNCWHCGKKGHYAGECEVNIKGLPQTPNGAVAYATYNRMRGETKPYNPRQELEKSERIRNKREQWMVNSDDNSFQSSKSRYINRSSTYNKKKTGRLSKMGNYRRDETDDNDTVNDPISVGSHVVEVVSDNENDDIVDDGVKRVIRLSSMHSSYKHSSLEQVKLREQKDRESGHASSLCLPIEINGVFVGDALCDQGATKTIIRATALERLNANVKEHEVKNHYVVCADDGEIPIRSRFNAMITSNGKSLGDSLIYVVDDKPDKDITCDMVLGRSTMASSKFNCIDTKKGTLFNRSTGDEIQCLPAQFIEVRSQKHIVPKSMKTVSFKDTVSNSE
jgi:hypothetical protein